MEENVNNFGERLRQAREKKRVSQEKLAEMLNISHKTENQYENGHTFPKADVIYEIVKILGCDPGWLITGKEPPSAAQPPGGAHPPEVRRYMDMVAEVLDGPDQKLAGRLEERIDMFYEELQRGAKAHKKGA